MRMPVYKNENILTPALINATVMISAQRKIGATNPSATTNMSVTLGTISYMHLDSMNELHVHFHDGEAQKYQLSTYDVEAREIENHAVDPQTTRLDIPHHHMSGEWRHYKGGVYQVLTVIKNQTSGKEEVLYLASGQLVVRDLDEFMDSNTSTGARRFVKTG